MIRRSKGFVVLFALVLVLVCASPLLAADTTKGTIKSVDTSHKQLVMTDENGTDWTFKVGDNLDVRVNDKAATLETLKPGDHVFITYAKTGNQLIASSIQGQGTKTDTADMTAEGKIKSIDPTNNEFVVTDKNNKDWTFKVNDTTRIRTSSNQQAKLEDLKTGQRVHVDFAKKGNNFFATRVREAQD
jgi:Cu/Ag efflux protein CusF